MCDCEKIFISYFYEGPSLQAGKLINPQNKSSEGKFKLKLIETGQV